MRLKAALSVAVLGASLATPAVDQALAADQTPSLPDISAALTAAGVSPTNVINELNTLEGVAPGGSLPLGSLSSLDNSLLTLNNGLVTSLLTLVTNLLTALNPAAPSNITSTLGGLQQILAAGPSSTVQAAVTELSAALTTAGLGQLLTQISGLTTAQNTSALSALAGLQNVPLGGSAPAGSLAPVGTVLSDMGLSSDAAILNGSGSLSPADLETVIGDLQSAAGSLPSPLNGVASALASQLADAGSIFGELGSVGNPVPSNIVTSALSALQSLPGLPAGSSVPGGLLAPVGSILTQLAAEPGVPASVAQTLTGIAAILDGSQAINPETLQILLTNLENLVSSLPSPLGGLLNQLLILLSGSGTLSGATAPGTGATSSGSGSGTNSGTGGHTGHAVITHLARHGRRLVVTLHCTASANRSCHTTVTVTEKGYRKLRKTIIFRGGVFKRVLVRLPVSAELAVVHKHRALKVLARTGSYTARRTIR